MKNYYGGESVKGGFYFGLQQKNIFDIEENQKLPGTEQDRYWRVPLIGMLFVAPLLGLLYVMFLPFITFAMVLGMLFKKASSRIKRIGYSLFGHATASWRPGYSFLTSGQSTKKTEVTAAKEPGAAVPKSSENVLFRLEKEIVERRKEGQQ
jgi:hypothetical protein